MLSASGRFALVFNGEIYNHLEIRRELGDSTAWRGHSDTETLLAGVERWGLEQTLVRACGMFALALWDRRDRVLRLARDRMGEKPLYHGWQGDHYLFASELKAFRHHPSFRAEIDREALALYVRNGYVPAPRSIFCGIGKLAPGTILTLPATASPGATPAQSPYWDLYATVTARRGVQRKVSPQQAVEELKVILLRAVDQSRLSDVPLGAFLSGGVDSSTVVALMQSQSSTPVRTFSIGFDDERYNEAHLARSVAEHLGCEHYELQVTAQDALAVVPELPRIYDEPFADVSQIPTVLVSRLARAHVTVSLSGDGGDELFCGYDRYSEIERRWKLLGAVSLPLRRAARYLLPMGPLKEGLAAASIDELYRFGTQQWKGFPGLVLGADEATLPLVPELPALSAKERMMFADCRGYLPDDILVKLDRAAMSTSLESRVPLLDHRVVEYAWSLPDELKCRNGVGKWPLKEILYGLVPRDLVDRPKMGFGAPVDVWLRGPLRGWASELLAESRLREQGLFDPLPIQLEWGRHLAATHDRQYGLWTILMFQAWHQEFFGCA